MVTTVVLAVKATPKAHQIMEELKDEKEAEEEEVTKMDIVKSTWKCYIPAAVSGACSIACLVLSNSINNKRKTAAITAYTVAQKALTEYKSEVVKTIGEEQEKAIRENIAQKKIDDNPPPTDKEIIIFGNSDVLCYDNWSGRYFYSSIESIKAAINKLNKNMLYNMYISLSDYYDEIGLAHTKDSDYVGWNISECGLIDISFSSALTKDNKPCVTVDYLVGPRYDFDKLM